MSVCVPNLVRSGVVSVGDSLVTGHGHSLTSARGMDQLRVVGVAPSATVTVASALSPGSLLFPFSDSCFAFLSSASSSHSLSLPDRGPSSSSFRSAPPPSSFPSPPPLPPSFPSSWDPASSLHPRPSVSSLPPFLVSLLLFPPLLLLLFLPLPFLFFTPLPPSVSFSLPSLASASSGVSTSAPLVSSFSSASSTSSFLDLPAYFLEVNKRAMLASPLVCADALFAESDIARLLSDTHRRRPPFVPSRL